jgi:bacteriorhodopsin
MASSPLISLFYPIAILTAIIIAYQLSHKKPNFSLKSFIISGLISLVVTFVFIACLAYPLIYSLGKGGMGLIFSVMFVLFVVIFVSIHWVTSEMIARRTRK